MQLEEESLLTKRSSELLAAGPHCTILREPSDTRCSCQAASAEPAPFDNQKQDNVTSSSVRQQHHARAFQRCSKECHKPGPLEWFQREALVARRTGKQGKLLGAMGDPNQHVRNSSAIFNSTRGERHPWDYDPLICFRQVDSPDTRSSLPIFTTAMTAVSTASSRRSSLSGSEVDLSEVRSQIGSERGLRRSRRSSSGGVDVVRTNLKPRLSKGSAKSGKVGEKVGLPKPKEAGKKLSSLSSSRRTSKTSAVSSAGAKSRLAGGVEKEAPKKKKGPKETPPKGNPLSPWTASDDVISPLVFTSSPSKRKGLFIEIPKSAQLSKRSSFAGSQSVASDNDSVAESEGHRSGRVSERSNQGKEDERISTGPRGSARRAENRHSHAPSRLGNTNERSPSARSEAGSVRTIEEEEATCSNPTGSRDRYGSAVLDGSRRSSASLSHLVHEDDESGTISGRSFLLSGIASSRAPSRGDSQHLGDGSHRSSPRQNESRREGRTRDVSPRGSEQGRDGLGRRSPLGERAQLDTMSPASALGGLEENKSVRNSSRGGSLGGLEPSRSRSPISENRSDTRSRHSRLDEVRRNDSVRSSHRGSPVAETEADRVSNRGDDRLDSGSRLSKRDELTKSNSVKSSPRQNGHRTERGDLDGSKRSSHRPGVSREQEESRTSRASSYRPSKGDAPGEGYSAREGTARDGETSRRTSRRSSRLEEEETFADEPGSPRSMGGSARARSSISVAIAAADRAVAAAMRSKGSTPTERSTSRASTALAQLETLAEASPKSTRSASPKVKAKSRSVTPIGRAAQERKAQQLSSGRSSVDLSPFSGNRSPRSSRARSPRLPETPRGRSPLGDSLLKVALTSPKLVRARNSIASIRPDSEQRGRSPTRDPRWRHTVSEVPNGTSPRRSLSASCGVSPRLSERSEPGGLEGPRGGVSRTEPESSRRSSKAQESVEFPERESSSERSSRHSSHPTTPPVYSIPYDEARGDGPMDRITPRKPRHSSLSAEQEKGASRSRSPSQAAHSRRSSLAHTPNGGESGAAALPSRRNSVAGRSTATSPGGSGRSPVTSPVRSSFTPKSPLGSVRRSFVAPTSPTGLLPSPRRPWGSPAPRSVPGSPRTATHLTGIKEDASLQKRRNSVAGSPTRQRETEGSEGNRKESVTGKETKKETAGEVSRSAGDGPTGTETGTPAGGARSWLVEDASEGDSRSRAKTTPGDRDPRDAHRSDSARSSMVAARDDLLGDLRRQVVDTARALEKERARVTFLEEELAASERFAKKLASELDDWKAKARQFETAAIQAEGRLEFAKRKEVETAELRQQNLKLEEQAEEWRQMYTRHRRMSVENEVAAAEKAGARAREETEAASASLREDIGRQLKATQDALNERDARARQLERDLTSERGARAAAEAEIVSLKSDAGAMHDALQSAAADAQRARRASEDLEGRLQDEAQMRLGLVERTEIRQLERALGERQAELQDCKARLAADKKEAAERTSAHEAERHALHASFSASARALANLAGASAASSPRTPGPVTNLDRHIQRVQRRLGEKEITATRLEELETRITELDQLLDARNEELRAVKKKQAEFAVAAGVESVELRRQFVEASEELTRVRKRLEETQRASDTWQDKEQKVRGELRVVKEQKEKTSEELTAVHRQARAANEEATRVRGQLIELQGKELVHREKEEELRDEAHTLREELNTLREMLLCLGDKVPADTPNGSPKASKPYRAASGDSGDAFATRTGLRSDVSDSDDGPARGQSSRERRPRAHRASRRLEFDDEVPVRDTDRSMEPEAAHVQKRTYESGGELDLAWAKHELKRAAAKAEVLKKQVAGKDCELAEAKIKLVEAKSLAHDAAAARKRESALRHDVEALRREVEEAERERDDLRRECKVLRARVKREPYDEERWSRRSPRSSLDRHSRRAYRKGFEQHECDHSGCDSECTEFEEDYERQMRRRRSSVGHETRTEGRRSGHRNSGSGRENGLRELQGRLAHCKEENRDLQSEIERMRQKQFALETEIKACRLENKESGDKVSAIREERRAAQEQLSVANEKLTRARRRVEELEAQVESLRAEGARSKGRHVADGGPELVAVMARAREAERELHEMRGLVARLREEVKKFKEAPATGRGDPLGEMISMPFRFEGVITSPR